MKSRKTLKTLEKLAKIAQVVRCYFIIMVCGSIKVRAVFIGGSFLSIIASMHIKDIIYIIFREFLESRDEALICQKKWHTRDEASDDFSLLLLICLSFCDAGLSFFSFLRFAHFLGVLEKSNVISSGAKSCLIFLDHVLYREYRKHFWLIIIGFEVMQQ